MCLGTEDGGRASGVLALGIFYECRPWMGPPRGEDFTCLGLRAISGTTLQGRGREKVAIHHTEWDHEPWPTMAFSHLLGRRLSRETLTFEPSLDASSLRFCKDGYLWQPSPAVLEEQLNVCLVAKQRER